MFNRIISSFGHLLSETNGGTPPWMWAILAVMVVAIFAFPMITRRKRGKQINDLRSTLRIGDEIMTIGGIVGIVVEVIERSPVDKDFVIETGTGNNRSTMLFDLRALHENRTRIKELREEAAKSAEIARINKENKKLGGTQYSSNSGRASESGGAVFDYNVAFSASETSADNPSDSTNENTDNKSEQ